MRGRRRKLNLRRWGWLLAGILPAVMGLSSLADAPGGNGQIHLRFRSRVPMSGEVGAFQVIEKPVTWEAKQTAVIVCDMWDLHHCLNAVRRAKEMAPTMDGVLRDARQRGMLVIHAPSSCMDAYKDHPARKRAVETPRSKKLPNEIGQWCYKIPSEEKGTYPIDQTDGGEDDDLAEHQAWAKKLEGMGRNPRAPWKSEIDLLTIDPAVDVINDIGEEIWSVVEPGGIPNVIQMGVHANMFVVD